MLFTSKWEGEGTHTGIERSGNNFGLTSEEELSAETGRGIVGDTFDAEEVEVCVNKVNKIGYDGCAGWDDDGLRTSGVPWAFPEIAVAVEAARDVYESEGIVEGISGDSDSDAGDRGAGGSDGIYIAGEKEAIDDGGNDLNCGSGQEADLDVSLELMSAHKERSACNGIITGSAGEVDGEGVELPFLLLWNGEAGPSG